MSSGARLQSKDVLDSVNDVLAASGIMRNQYFTTLDSGEMSLEVFRRTQEQFYFAVDFFTRPMSALMMRLACPHERLGILKNIVEEHGNFRSGAFHETTFRQFLNSIGANGERPENSAMAPCVHAFNATMMSACLSENIRTGIACLGIIEYAFADISALIGKAAVVNHWVREAELVHYKLHAEIDKQHAEDFFRLNASEQAVKGEGLEIQQGLRLGAYAFDRLYRDLLEA
jgi:pyrroloquinoline-quinone synthase